VRGASLPKHPFDTASKGGAPMAMLRFGKRSFPTRSCKGGQIRAGAPQLRLLDQPPHLSRNLRAELIDKMRALFCIVGVFVGAYAYSPSVMAEGEEGSSQDESTYSSDIPTIIRAIINSTIDLESDAASDISNADYYHINNIHIPDTVWNLDARPGVRLGRIDVGADSAMYAVFGARRERAGFWSETTLGLWNNNATNPGPNLLIPPALFQVASCGGSSAEHSDLDYCGDINLDDKLDDNSSNYKHTNNNPAIQNTDNDVANSNNTSNTPSPNPSVSSNIAPPMPSNFLMSGDLTLAGQCDGVSISCVPIDIEPLAALNDSSLTPSVDDLTPPIDDLVPTIGVQTPSIGDQTPPPIDLSSPPPDSGGGDSGAVLGQRPIPEAPTWVMTAIGFSIVAFIFRRKKNSRIHSISIIDNR
jgi:hypothetical protein